MNKNVTLCIQRSHNEISAWIIEYSNFIKSDICEKKNSTNTEWMRKKMIMIKYNIAKPDLTRVQNNAAAHSIRVLVCSKSLYLWLINLLIWYLVAVAVVSFALLNAMVILTLTYQYLIYLIHMWDSGKW